MSQFVICLDNHDYPASLERGKIYRLFAFWGWKLGFNGTLK